MSYQALLFCPDDKTARTVAQVLSELDFSVEPAADPFAAVKKLMAQHFDAIVVDCENEQNASLIFKSARNSSSNQASLSVAVVEGQAGVAKAFRIGANLVLTKPINIEQSKGTLRVARGLLRKGAEGAKSSTGASTAPAANHPGATQAKSVPSFPMPKLDSARPTPSASVPSGSLESERESSPRLDPTEAAVLESMPNTVPHAVGEQSEGASTSKNYPWQPTPKTSAGPMAAALQKAAEAAGKSLPAETHEVGKASSSLAGSAAKQTIKPTAMASGQGAASAPALAKELFQASAVESEPSVAVPTTKREADRKTQLTARSDADTWVADSPSFGMDAKEAEPSERNNRPIFAAVAVLVLAVAAYFGWTTLHGKVSQPAAAPVPAQSVPAPAPQVTAAPVAEDVTPSQTLESKPSPAAPFATTVKSSVVPSPKATSTGAIAEDKTVTIENTQPMLVKSEGARPAHSSAESETEPEAPSALGISGGSSSDVSELSNVAPAVPVNASKPVPQVVNISQGVSQGLILKKVQPSYPAQALSIQVQGPVQLQATISKNGDITNLKVVSGQPMLVRAAMEAVRQWKYKPYFLNGQPVDVQTEITVNFRLPN
jgi:TonB family protein